MLLYKILLEIRENSVGFRGVRWWERFDLGSMLDILEVEELESWLNVQRPPDLRAPPLAGCDSQSPQITPLPLNSMVIEFFLEQHSKPMLFYILSISWFIYKKNSYDSLFVFVIINVQEEYNLCRMITKVQIEPNCELSSLISSLLTLWHWKTLVKLSCNARYISIKEKIKK